MRHYLQRWRVEDFFRVLKSGCRVEHLAFRSADRLQRAIAINAVIDWRIMLMTLLDRETPAYQPGLMFTDHELGFLADYAGQFGLDAPTDLGPQCAWWPIWAAIGIASTTPRRATRSCGMATVP